MSATIRSLILLIVIATAGCNMWEDHYEERGEMVDQTLWSAIVSNPDYSGFVEQMEHLGLDSLFQMDESLTLFIPANEAFNSFDPETATAGTVLRYHMLNYVFNIYNMDRSGQVQTVTGKFAPVEQYSGLFSFNGIPIDYASPLYRDGRFYEIAEIAWPLANLYEYISGNARVVKGYIDSYDSILMDMERSVPLGFDDYGNIIYDSVYSVINLFDSIWFSVNQEARSTTATFLLCHDEQYDRALVIMAEELGLDAADTSVIPAAWQDEVLLPEIVERGLFPNSLHYEDLMAGRLKNVRGDSVSVDYENIDPESRTLCSNGVVFLYDDFRVPDHLYKGETRIEGEHMVEDRGGVGQYSWRSGFNVSGPTATISTPPSVGYLSEASNDSLLTLEFPEQPYQDEFEMEFVFKNMFPQRYRFIWAANYRPSGFYEVHINDEVLKLTGYQTEQFDMFNLRKTVFSVDGSTYYYPENGNNKVDAWVDHLIRFGDIKVTLKYRGPGGSAMIEPLNGISIDYIALVPEPM